MSVQAAIYWSFLNVKKASPKLTEAIQEEIDNLKYDDLYNVEAWYSSMQETTFRTQFVQLTAEEISAICDLYRFTQLHDSTIHVNDVALDSIAQKLDAALSQYAEHSAFVRLSARSPKDAAFGSTAMKDVLRHELEQIPSSLSPVEVQNAEFAAFFRAQLHSLRVHTGAEAVVLLGHSERVFIDLTRTLKLREQVYGTTIPVNLVVREWTTLDLNYEFRGFVYNRKLTALTQYFDMCYFDDIANDAATIADRVRQYFEREVLPRLPYQHCIVDFAVRPGDGSIQCIELNPWGHFTSACLFDWKRDLVLLQGGKPFEFRYITSPLPILRAPPAQGGLDLSGIDLSVLHENAGLLAMLQEHTQDDLQRINAQLRYVLSQRVRTFSTLTTT
eukprot:TRINITY_DN12856_c0_g1_i1.p1 TRINITY_DN12856_c0_g1~~TRINITY_DN12856_c0_g1_i1.p1  ORF type:complete len:396 (+),score=81.96 TRINITY_DN12856_c0_g1_i1:27-1190(+)